jgi:hypothetical protein
MRLTLRKLPLVLVAMLALSAVAVSSASAAPEWHVKKGGTWSKVTGSVAVKPQVVKVGLALGTAKEGFACTSTEGSEGALEAGGLAKLTRFLMVPEPSHNCEPVKGKGIGNYCVKVTKITDVHLPWKLQLSAEGTEIRGSLSSSGAGTPGLEVRCTSEFLGEFLLICESETTGTSVHLVNNSTLGLVEGHFDAKSAKWQCTGGAGTPGEWLGTVNFKPTAEEKSKGIEAIKVE